jgi:hypothetical protein
VPEKPTRRFTRTEILKALQALGDELTREGGLHSPQEALDLMEHMYPTREPVPKTQLFLEELFGPTADG